MRLRKNKRIFGTSNLGMTVLFLACCVSHKHRVLTNVFTTNQANNKPQPTQHTKLGMIDWPHTCTMVSPLSAGEGQPYTFSMEGTLVSIHTFTPHDGQLLPAGLVILTALQASSWCCVLSVLCYRLLGLLYVTGSTSDNNRAKYPEATRLSVGPGETEHDDVVERIPARRYDRRRPLRSFLYP